MPIRHRAALRRDAPKLLFVGGAMLAFMSWATFQMPSTPLVRLAGCGLAGLATAAAAMAMTSLLRGARRQRHAGETAASGRSGKVALLVLALVVAWVLAMLPTRGVWSWLATAGTLLAVLAAVYMGLRIARGGTSALLRQARLLHEEGDDAGALERLDALDADRPDDPAGLQLRTTILRKAKRFGAAHSAARRLIKACPELYHGYAEEGLVYLDEKKPADACLPLERGAQVAPNLGEAHLNLGLALVEADRAADAVATLERALSLGLADEFDELVGQYRLYQAYRATHRYEDATAALARLKRARGTLRRWRLATQAGADDKLLREIERLAKK